MKGLILIGGGGHCHACIDVIEREGKHRIAGILDHPDRRGEEVLGYEILGGDDQIPGLIKEGHAFLITLGQIQSPERRIAIFEQLQALGAELISVVSPLAHLSPHAEIGVGTIVMHQALVNAKARVGANCIINSQALVEHDAVIEDHCHVSTGAKINGNAKLGRESFVGSGAILFHEIQVGAGSLIAAGVVVRRNKPPQAKVLL